MTKVFRKGRPNQRARGWTDLIEDGLASVGEPSRDKIYASNAGLCYRQTAGLLLLPDEHQVERKASTQFYFKIGSAFENVMQRAFRHEGVYLDAETQVRVNVGDYEVSGRIDFVLEDISNPDGDPVLVELKTCGKLPSVPRPYQKAQLLTYLLLTGMPKGLLWYVSRNVAKWDGTLLQRVFEVVPTQEELERTAQNLAIGSVYAKAKHLPPVPPFMRISKCGFCPLKPLCWDDVDLDLETEAGPPDSVALAEEAQQLADELLEARADNRNAFLHTFA